MVNERRWLVLIFALYFLFAAGYSLLMPIWEAPDEPAHYHLSWHLARYSEYATPDVNYETHQPRTYYYLGSWVIRALNRVDPALAAYRLPREIPQNIRKSERRFEWSNENYRFIPGVYLLRWVNILFGGLALWLNWKTFKHIAPDRATLSFAALTLAALMPQYLHIMSAVNNDALGTLAGALLFYLAIQNFRQRSVWLSLLSILLAVILPLITKLTVLPVSLAVLLSVAWSWISGTTQKRWLSYSALLLLLGLASLYLLFPETIRTAVNEIQWRLFSFRKNALTWKYIKLITGQIVWTYWGKVGWLAVGLPAWTVGFLTGFGLIGMGLQMYSLIRSKTAHPNFKLWITAWLVVSFTVLAVLRNGLTTYGTQGRFLFPAIGALSLLMIAGWHEALPPRFQQYLPVFIILFLLVCNVVLWLTGILPIYYQPFAD